MANTAFNHDPALTVAASNTTAGAAVKWVASKNLGESLIILDSGGNGRIGLAGDLDLITLTANTVTVAGTVAATAITGVDSVTFDEISHPAYPSNGRGIMYSTYDGDLWWQANVGVSITRIQLNTVASGTTINTNADNRVITGSGDANTLNGETGLTFNAGVLTVDSGATNVSAIVSIEVDASATSDPMLRWREGSGNGDANNQQYEAWMDVENGQFRFRSQNINGSSQEGDIWTVNDGTNSVGFNGAIILKSDSSGFGAMGAPDDMVLYIDSDNNAGDSSNSFWIRTNSASGTSRFRVRGDGVSTISRGTQSVTPHAATTLALENAGDSALTISSNTGDWARLILADASSNVACSIDHADDTTNFSMNGSAKMRIYDSGNIGAPSGSNIYNASDARFKRNVTSLTGSLDKIKQLQGVSFNWIEGFVKEEQGKTLYGFIAQDVTSVDSHLVEAFGDEPVLLDTGESIENPLRVNEKFILPLLVEAVKELNAKIETLGS